MNIKYGYPTKFNIGLPRLLSEIKFAKRHFDFIEITFEIDPEHLDLLIKYTSQDILKIKKELNKFNVICHFDWDVNPFNHFKEICDSIKVLKRIGIQQLIIHPYPIEQKIKKDVEINFNFISKINKVCRQNKIQLCLENNGSKLFQKVSDFAKLINKFSDILITLDIGHANKTSKSEFDLFLKKFSKRIKHIHLHDNIGDIDHLFFKNKNKLKKIIKKINSIDYFGTITIETHYIFKNNKKIYLSAYGDKINEKRKSFINQLKMINNIKI